MNSTALRRTVKDILAMTNNDLNEKNSELIDAIYAIAATLLLSIVILVLKKLYKRFKMEKLQAVFFSYHHNSIQSPSQLHQPQMLLTPKIEEIGIY
jgi:hypothetical protein